MEVPRDKVQLRDDKRLISPPFVAPPYQCAKAITVRGFIRHARIQVDVAGSVAVDQTAGYPEPNGQTFPLPAPLVAGQVVRVRQRVDGVWSAWSAPVTVRSHLEDFPAGPPRPQINPAPVYECGSRTGVANLLTGCNVWITADSTEVGRVDGAAEHQGVNVNPDYTFNQNTLAFAELCRDPSPPSELQIAQPAPNPLPTPGIDPVYEGGEQIRINTLVNGARFTLKRGGTPLGTWRTWGYAHLVGLNPPFSAGEVLEVTQTLCPGNPPSPPGSTTVRPCSALPAPVVAPVQDGDTSVTLLDFVPDARIKVFVNGVKTGDGGGSVIMLTSPVPHGATIDVLQVLGSCVGSTVWETHAQCVAPPVSANPAALDLFPVGQKAYNTSTIPFLGEMLNVKGTVYYPAQSDGEGTPFNERWAGLGRVPIVFIAHGNHGTFNDPANRNNESCGNPGGWVEIPNHEGYDYFQRQLARMGIIAVSVYSNQANCRDYSITTIRRRAELILASIRRFQDFDGGVDPIFAGRIDFARVGLMGHSQGAEAVVVVPEISPLPAGVTIKAVISIDPTDFGASSGAPRGYAFMTILPAGNGDVRPNYGAKFYDKADPAPFKCQVYVHHANHNFFNRQWPGNDGVVSTIMPRGDHEAVLSAYGCAFYRAVLLAQSTTSYLNGRLLPAGAPNANVHLSFKWERQTTVDDHEDGNGIGLNSMGQPTTQSGGLTADEYPFAQVPGSFNGSFFGNTFGMIAQTKEVNGTFRSQLTGANTVNRREIWVRVAEVFNGTPLPPNATGFQMGLETTSGAVFWVDSDEVGGLPRPFLRPDGFNKTMLKTLRFPARCFQLSGRRPRVRAILLRLNRGDQRALAFDDLQIVSS